MILRLALVVSLAIPLGAQDLQSLLVQGSQALASGNSQAAEAAFRQALRLQPASLPVLNNLAIALTRQGKMDEAEELYRRALTLAPDDRQTSRNLAVLYFRTQQYEKAWPLLAGLAKSEPDFQVESLAGLTLFALDRYAEAAEHLERAHTLQSSDLPTLDLLGKAYLRTANFGAVTRVYGEMLRLDPDAAQAHLLMGIAYDRQMRDADAQAELEAARRVDAHLPGVHAALGNLYWRQSKPDLALSEFETELAANPNDPTSLYTAGLIKLQQNSAAEAASYLERAAAANPGSKETLLALGKARIALHQAKEAIPVLRHAIAIDSSLFQAHYLLGTALRQTGDAAAAMEESAKARDLQAEQRAVYTKKLSGAAKQ